MHTIASHPNRIGQIVSEGLTDEQKIVQYVYNEASENKNAYSDLDGQYTELIRSSGGGSLIARRTDGSLAVVYAVWPSKMPVPDPNNRYDQLICTIDEFWLAVTPEGTVKYVPKASDTEERINGIQANYAWLLSRTDVKTLH